uniref:Uncharacterized protein n=1 Tax=Fagus sylvatica TaxID=28930 RepID=A0A2N9EDU3_FAGSY
MGLWWMSGSVVALYSVWCVGEPIWVLGVAAAWVLGWGFWVDGCRESRRREIEKRRERGRLRGER